MLAKHVKVEPALAHGSRPSFPVAAVVSPREISRFTIEANNAISRIVPEKFDVLSKESLAFYKKTADTCNSLIHYMTNFFIHKIETSLNQEMQEQLLLIVYSAIVCYEYGFARAEDYACLYLLYAILNPGGSPLSQHTQMYLAQTRAGKTTIDYTYLIISERVYSHDLLYQRELANAVLVDPFKSCMTGDATEMKQGGEQKIGPGKLQVVGLNQTLHAHLCYEPALLCQRSKRPKSRRGKRRRLPPIMVPRVNLKYPAINSSNYGAVQSYVRRAFSLMRARYTSYEGRPYTPLRGRDIADLPSLDKIFNAGPLQVQKKINYDPMIGYKLGFCMGVSFGIFCAFMMAWFTAHLLHENNVFNLTDTPHR